MLDAQRELGNPVGFLRDKLPLRTEVPGLYMAGMFNSYPERSINDSLRLGFETAGLILGQDGKA